MRYSHDCLLWTTHCRCKSREDNETEYRATSFCEPPALYFMYVQYSINHLNPAEDSYWEPNYCEPKIASRTWFTVDYMKTSAASTEIFLIGKEKRRRILVKAGNLLKKHTLGITPQKVFLHKTRDIGPPSIHLIISHGGSTLEKLCVALCLLWSFELHTNGISNMTDGFFLPVCEADLGTDLVVGTALHLAWAKKLLSKASATGSRTFGVILGMHLNWSDFPC